MLYKHNNNCCTTNYYDYVICPFIFMWTSQDIFNMIALFYIIQIPIAHINSMFLQIWLKFITINNFSLIRINNSLHVIKPYTTINFSVNNSTVIHRVNFYALLLRVIILYVFNTIPIIHIFIFIVYAVIFILFFKYYTYNNNPNSYFKLTQKYTPLHSAIQMKTSGMFVLGTL